MAETPPELSGVQLSGTSRFTPALRSMASWSPQRSLVECLIRRGKQHIVYKRLNNEGHVYTTVAPGELTRIDLWITQA